MALPQCKIQRDGGLIEPKKYMGRANQDFAPHNNDFGKVGRFRKS